MSGRACPRCGEALLGAVNRCWKCGLDLRAATNPGAIATSVTSAEPLIVAELAPEEAISAAVVETVPQPAPPTSPTISPTPGEIIGFTPEGSPVRRGSPFAAGSLLLPPPQAPKFGAAAKRTPPTLQQAYASSGGAIAALVLGVFGIILAPLRFEGAIVGLVGLVMGIWGLYSKRRGWALVGLILCCLAIGLGMYTGAWWLFQMMNNTTPWQYG